MTPRYSLAAVSAAAIFGAAVNADVARRPERPRDTPELAAVRLQVTDWADSPRLTAEKLVAQYGAPDESTPSMLMWNNLRDGPWKRIVLHRYEVPHLFPYPHTDFLEQVLDYAVPLERVGDLVAFDGSLAVDRTRGELIARCNSEKTNYAIINVANAIVAGRISVEIARQQLADAVLGADPKTVKLTEKLQFEPVSIGAATDVDRPTDDL